MRMKDNSSRLHACRVDVCLEDVGLVVSGEETQPENVGRGRKEGLRSFMKRRNRYDPRQNLDKRRGQSIC